MVHHLYPHELTVLLCIKYPCSASKQFAKRRQKNRSGNRKYRRIDLQVCCRNRNRTRMRLYRYLFLRACNMDSQRNSCMCRLYVLC